MTKSREIYIVHAGNYIGAYMDNGKTRNISYAPRGKFIDFVKQLMTDYPDYKPRCILNEGLSEYICKRIETDKRIMAMKQKER